MNSAMQGMIIMTAAFFTIASAAYAEQGEMGQEGQATDQQTSGQKDSTAAMSSDTIKQAQQALNEKGYDSGPADGKWGSKTKSAVENFQQSQGMEANGELDQQTLAALGISGGTAAGGGDQGNMDEGPQNDAGGPMSEGQEE